MLCMKPGEYKSDRNRNLEIARAIRHARESRTPGSRESLSFRTSHKPIAVSYDGA